MRSGDIPYQYILNTLPFRIESDETVGLSGILFEQGSFVLTAEVARQGGSLAHPFYTYINPFNARSLYAPTISGDVLAQTGVPACANFIDYILDMRSALTTIFSQINLDSDYSTAQISGDYFNHVYDASTPNNKSGFTTTAELPTGNITTVNTILGGSGALYDIDLGEVLYQPYPRFSTWQREDSHNGTQPVNIISGPIYPMFHDTNGGLVDTNARDDTNIVAGTEINNAHVQSGVLRIHGDVLLANSEYMIGEPFSGWVSFSSSGNRSLGNNLFNHYSQCFVTPVATNTGVYRTAIRNTKDVFPKNNIVSGDISTWPRVSDYHKDGRPSADSVNVKRGFHVFNDTIWVTDRIDLNKPSGLVALSPYNGDNMWMRMAELTDSTAGRNWGECDGLLRLGTNNILRVGGDTPGGDPDIHFMQYNDLLDFVTETTVTITGVNGHNPAFSDLFSDGTYIYVMDTNASLKDVFRFTTGFVHDGVYEASNLAGPTVNATRAEYFNSKFWHFGASGGLQEFQLDDVAEIATNVGAGKPIDASDFSAIGTIDVVHDIAEISGSEHLTDGIWAIIEDSLTTFLVRMTEETTTFKVQEMIPVTLGSPFLVIDNIDMVHLDIN
jgi:hypothetical protein